MVAYLIRMDNPDGLPLYFAPMAARGLGGGTIQGWTIDKEKALGFARKCDAQHFIDGMLPRQAAELRAEVAQVSD